MRTAGGSCSPSATRPRAPAVVRGARLKPHRSASRKHQSIRSTMQRVMRRALCVGGPVRDASVRAARFFIADLVCSLSFSEFVLLSAKFPAYCVPPTHDDCCLAITVSRLGVTVAFYSRRSLRHQQAWFEDVFRGTSHRAGEDRQATEQQRPLSPRKRDDHRHLSRVYCSVQQKHRGGCPRQTGRIRLHGMRRPLLFVPPEMRGRLFRRLAVHPKGKPSG